MIRCAGNGRRRCRRQLGAAYTNLGRKPENPILGLDNRGWSLEHGNPILEDDVPPDFSGATGILNCPDHGMLITERSDAPPRAPGLRRGRWIEGMPVQMPLHLLRDPYERFLRSGVTQELLWAPGVSSTVLAREL